MNLIHETDILIVGGGPAGLAAALASVEKNIKVVVLEKSLEIGYPVHTSGGSWTRELTELGIPEKYMHPVKTLEFISNQSRASFDYDPAEICIIDIRGVYQYLAEQASLKGAVILTNTIAKEPIYKDGKLCGVRAVRNGVVTEFSAKLVIDASGFSSVIARPMGLKNQELSFGKGAEFEIITTTWQQDKSTIMLGSAFSPVGYAWVFPYGENRARVGIGVIAPKCKANPMELLEAFMNSNHPIAQQLQPYSIIETHLGSVPNAGYIDKSYSDNLLVVGDAAGHVLGIAGEGIRLALEIGKMAGETSAEAIRKNDTSAMFLSRYEAAWKKKYARSISLNHTINGIIGDFSDGKWDKVMDILQNVDKEIVLKMMKGYFDLNLLTLIMRRNPALLAYKTAQIISKAITGK